MTSPTSHPLEGKIIGRYQLHRCIGRGGMASVFLAEIIQSSSLSSNQVEGWSSALWRHHSTEQPVKASTYARWVALKLLHPHLAEDPRSVRRFIEEIGVASQLKHPNICHVLDLGDDQGVPYLVMPYLEGKPISHLIYAEDLPQIPLDVCISLTLDLATGLHHAHHLYDSEGRPLKVVHRDVSPHNAFAEYSGLGKVLDFGIAHVKRGRGRTTTGHALGKVAYMAPEQFDGERVDQRADLWALSVTFWEMLTQRPLFDSEHHMKTMYQVMNAPIVPPSHFRSDVPPLLDQITLLGLQRDVNHRPPDLQEWASPLRAWFTQREIDHSARHLIVERWLTDLFDPKEDFTQAQLPLKSAHSSSVSLASVSLPSLEQMATPYPSHQPSEDTESTAHPSPTQEYPLSFSPHLLTFYKKAIKNKLILAVLLLSVLGVCWSIWRGLQKPSHRLKRPPHLQNTRLILGEDRRKKGGLLIKTTPCLATVRDKRNQELIGRTPLNRTLEPRVYSLSLTPIQNKKKHCETRSILVEIKEETLQSYHVDLRVQKKP